MRRLGFVLCALLPALPALALDIRPGLYEQSGSYFTQATLDGQSLPPSSPSHAPPAPVCIPADSAAWLARQIASSHPAEAKLALEPQAPQPHVQTLLHYRLLAPVALGGEGDQAKVLTGYTASVLRISGPGSAPDDFATRFVRQTETRQGRFVESAYSHTHYRYLGADCGSLAPQKPQD